MKTQYSQKKAETLKPKNLKEARIALRMNQQQKDLITKAAEVKHTSLSHFILESASLSAQEVLRNESHFVLPPEKWKAFCDILDRPTQKIEALRKLLEKDTVFNES